MTLGAIVAVEPVPGFVGNDSFRVLTGDGEVYYLKSGAASAIRAEAWACERARGVGVLAPDVVAVELRPVDLPQAYLIQRAVAGSAAQESDLGVLRAAGEQLRRLHDVPGSGFGFLHEGLQESWPDVLRRPLRALEALTSAGMLPAELAERVQETLPGAIDRLEPVTPTLLHGDLHPRHVYAADGELTGIIDWGDAAFGDPLFDLGRFSRSGTTATDALLAGYGLERTPDITWKLAVYQAVWSLMALHWELTAGGDWFIDHTTALTHTLPQLDRR